MFADLQRKSNECLVRIIPLNIFWKGKNQERLLARVW
jgi:hypothetical protein